VRVLELSLRNFRMFDEVDLELPARVIGIFGPNGAGKSTLVESVAFALYGVEAARTKKDLIRSEGVLADCEVRLVFEHGGEHYEIRRAIKGRGHTPEAELFVGDLLLASGTTEVDAEVQRLLHMDLRVFRSSVYAEQKQLDAFSDVTSARRKEMALRLLGIKPVDEARMAAKREARASLQGAARLEGAVADIAELEAALKEAEDLAAEAASSVTAAASASEGAAGRVRAASEAFELIDAARQHVEKLRVAIDAAANERSTLADDRDARRERHRAITDALQGMPALEQELEGLAGIQERVNAGERLASLDARRGQLRAQLEELPAEDAEAVMAALEAARRTADEAREAAARATSEHDRAADALAEAAEHVERAAEADPGAPCPTCGRPLGEGFAAYVRTRKAEAAAAKKALAGAEKATMAAVAAAQAARAELEEAQALGERVRTAADRRTLVLEQLAEIDAEATPIAAIFDGGAADVDLLRKQRDRADQLTAELGELRGERKRLVDLEADLVALDAKIAQLDGSIATLIDEAETTAFDAEAHARARGERDEADRALESARQAERTAVEATARAEADRREIAGRLAKAKETAAAVDELRVEARHLDRTAILLDGFRDHLVARVGPELSREAEAIFRELTNHEYDDLKIDEETLTIQIADGDRYFPIQRFSGSESDLANLALRVAISTHLSRVSGADVGFLVLDEVLASLDQERKDLMVQTMGRLSERFHQLFVITHAEQVKDQFPVSIIVNKTGRRRSSATVV
jgi:exonuclease SbcC